MKIKISLLAVLMFFSSSLFSNQSEVVCQLDDSEMYFTGTTKVSENGKLLKLYKCKAYGHNAWVVAR